MWILLNCTGSRDIGYRRSYILLSNDIFSHIKGINSIHSSVTKSLPVITTQYHKSFNLFNLIKFPIEFIAYFVMFLFSNLLTSWLDSFTEIYVLIKLPCVLCSRVSCRNPITTFLIWIIACFVYFNSFSFCFTLFCISPYSGWWGVRFQSLL